MQMEEIANLINSETRKQLPYRKLHEQLSSELEINKKSRSCIKMRMKSRISIAHFVEEEKENKEIALQDNTTSIKFPRKTICLNQVKSIRAGKAT